MYFLGQSQKAQRPKLPSFGPYEPNSPPSSPSQYGTGALLASCRALQSMLGGPVQTPKSFSVEDSDMTDTSIPSQSLQLPAPIIRLPRGANKRSRDEYEEDVTEDVEDLDVTMEDRDVYQTPKRQRFDPQDLPLGLNASDFDSLITHDVPEQQMDDVQASNQTEDTTTSIPHDPPLRIRARLRSQNRDSRIQQTPKEDRRLIDSMWSKLNLTSRGWNDCTQQVTKDKVSLGQRWKMLAGR